MSIPPQAKHSRLASRKNQQLEIAVETARLICDEGIDNIHTALLKAAHKYSIIDRHLLPDEQDIIFQIKIHQSLHQSPYQKHILKSLRETAFNVMKLLAVFKPKLIGSVLKGYAHEHSSIDLLLKTDSPEEVAILLMSHEIPYQLYDWKLHFGKTKSRSASQTKTQNKAQLVPSYQFYVDKHTINLIILAENHQKVILLEPGSWQPVQRASIKQLEALLSENS
ncbi:MAG: hypothetical protein OQL19_13100 [Gammaproteobacteria bacterium]|nr:hypothetical protein [Gammaproteobacteria bacterium]